MSGLLAALLLAGAGATQAATPAPKPQVFAAERALVAVDVSVVDARGRPLRELRPEDFHLAVDGRPRPIVSLQFVAEGEAAGPPPPALPPGLRTNEGVARGRLVILAIDQGGIRRGSVRDVTAAADRLLDQLGPADRVGLVTFPPPGPGVEPTGDVVAVRKALARVVGQARLQGRRVGLVEALAQQDEPWRWSQVLERECPPTMSGPERAVCTSDLDEEATRLATTFRESARRSLGALSGLFEALGGIEGPKTVLLVSQGLYAESRSELRELARAAQRARVTLFALQLDRPGFGAEVAARSPSAQEDVALLTKGLDDLATQARGADFRLVGDGEAVFERIGRELGGYYLLGFEPEKAERDERDHQIRVEVDAPGATVRARRSIRIPRAAAPLSAEQRVGAALRSPFALPDVSLRVATYSVPAPEANRVRLLIDVELPHTEAATVGFVLLDEKGTARASGARPAAGGHVLLATDVPAGSYTLRVAAVDPQGSAGRLGGPVRAALTSQDGVLVSDLLLTRSVGGSERLTTVAPAGGLGARVSLRATEPGKLEGLRARFEVADDADGPALLAAEGPVRPSAGRPGEAEARAALALGTLPPGDYLVRARVGRAGAEIARLSRVVRVPELEPMPSAPGKGGGRRIAAREIAPLLPRFDPARALDPKTVAYFVERMEKLAGPATSPLLARARARARAGELVPLLDDLASVRQEGLDVEFLRGLSLLARRDLAGAETHLRAALRQSSEFVGIAYFLGACQAARGLDAEAIGAWQTALIGNPNAPGVRELLAEASLRANQPDQALAALDEVEAPSDDRSLRVRAVAEAMAGRSAPALEHLDASLERAPDDLLALYLTLRLTFEAHAAGRPAPLLDSDPARFRRYARAYVEGGGPQREIVERWLRWLEQQDR